MDFTEQPLNSGFANGEDVDSDFKIPPNAHLTVEYTLYVSNDDPEIYHCPYQIKPFLREDGLLEYVTSYDIWRAMVLPFIDGVYAPKCIAASPKHGWIHEVEYDNGKTIYTRRCGKVTMEKK